MGGVSHSFSVTSCDKSCQRRQSVASDWDLMVFNLHHLCLLEPTGIFFSATFLLVGLRWWFAGGFLDFFHHLFHWLFHIAEYFRFQVYPLNHEGVSQGLADVSQAGQGTGSHQRMGITSIAQHCSQETVRVVRQQLPTLSGHSH